MHFDKTSKDILGASKQGKGMTFAYDATRVQQPDFLLDKDSLLMKANAGDLGAQFFGGYISIINCA